MVLGLLIQLSFLKLTSCIFSHKVQVWISCFLVLTLCLFCLTYDLLVGRVLNASFLGFFFFECFCQRCGFRITFGSSQLFPWCAYASGIKARLSSDRYAHYLSETVLQVRILEFEFIAS